MTELLIAPADKTVTITVQQRTWKTPADTFRVLVPIDLPTVFRPVAPFPGITRIANGILFLASDEASYITGPRLPVAGGGLG